MLTAKRKHFFVAKYDATWYNILDNAYVLPMQLWKESFIWIATKTISQYLSSRSLQKSIHFRHCQWHSESQQYPFICSHYFLPLFRLYGFFSFSLCLVLYARVSVQFWPYTFTAARVLKIRKMTWPLADWSAEFFPFRFGCLQSYPLLGLLSCWWSPARQQAPERCCDLKPSYFIATVFHDYCAGARTIILPYWQSGESMIQ